MCVLYRYFGDSCGKGGMGECCFVDSEIWEWV